MTAARPYARAHAEWIAGLSIDTVPPEVLERARTCLLYTVSMTVVGQADDTVARSVRDVHDAPGSASLLVDGARRAPAAAARFNAAVSASRGQNDTHPGSVGHAGCIVVPAVLALAQARRSTGRDVLLALVAGYEMLPALALDVASEVVARGFRATAVFGPLVAAAACARLIGLPAERIAHAISIATQSAGGTMQCWSEGTPEWRLQVGHAAAAGIEAALLAERDFVGAAASLEGDSGWYRAFAGRVPPLRAPAWHLAEMVFKPYPGCLINQAPVHLVLESMRDAGLGSDDIETIDVAMSDRDARYPGVDQYGPFEQETGAVMSLAFMVESAVRHGTLRAADFRDRHGPDPIHAASRRVRLVLDPRRSPWSFGVKLHLRDGRAITAQLPDQSSFAFDWTATVRLLEALRDEWPLPDAHARFAALKRAVETLDAAPDVEGLITPCVPGEAG